MAVYEPRNRSELGKNALNPRVNALRAMNRAGGVRYRRYDRSGKAPSYQVVTPQGETRGLATGEVPAYVIGMRDSYEGVVEQVQEALSAALSDPDVTDRETLILRVLSGLDEECGVHLRRAADFFLSGAEPAETAVA